MNAPMTSPTPQLRPLTSLPNIATLVAHPLANRDRMMDDHELEGLKTSIKTNGFRKDRPIVLFEGKILDGRNRTKAALAIGYKFTPADFVEFIGTLADAERWVDAENLHRRHLTAEDKKQRVLKMLAEHPGRSKRKIAEACGVSHTFVNDLCKPEGDPTFDRFAKDWDKLSSPQRERFVTQFTTDLRELLG
jgi:ParB-like nuclease family protein